MADIANYKTELAKTVETAKASSRLLDPVDRDSEFLFGLIMALTFTCTLSATSAGEGDIRTVMYGALACNVAWGVVDAVMYLLSSLAERGRSLLSLRKLRNAQSTDTVRPIIEEGLPESVIAVLSAQELDELRRRIAELPLPAGPVKLTRSDYLAALAVFVIVVLSTVPVILPLAVIDDPGIALRVSNAVAVALLYYCGRLVGLATGTSPRRTGLAMVAIGVVLVAITIVLGG
jgi:hypothetical protein